MISSSAVTDSLEAELDRLFQLPLTTLVEARDALVDRLRKAGDKAAASRVKGLRRPTPAAWAINQLHFAEPGLLARARAVTDEVRALHAQEGVDPRALSAALLGQRAALQEVFSAALRRCDEAGLPSGPVQQRKLRSTVQGLLAGSGDEAPGRLTHDLDAGGFDAVPSVGGVAERARDHGRSLARPAPVKAGPAPDTERLVRARAVLREHELRAHEAHKRVQERRTEEARVARDQASAEARVHEAEQVLEALRARWRERADELLSARAQLAEALSAETAVRAELERAQRELAGLDAG